MKRRLFSTIALVVLAELLEIHSASLQKGEFICG